MAKYKIKFDEIVSDDIDKDTLKNKLLDIGYESFKWSR